MKDTNTLDIASGTGSREKSSNGRFDAAGVQLGVKAPVKRNRLAGLEEALVDSDNADATIELDLRTRFIEALRVHQAASESLSTVVREAIEHGFDRDDVIQWGIDADIRSESYIRSVVSVVYSDIVGHVRKAGGGRKANKGAQGYADRTLRECGGSYVKAKALLLAARRLVEKMEAQASKA